MSEKNLPNSKTDSAANGDCRPVPCSLLSSDLLEIRETLWAAMDDIREHLQVCKYNLRGEALGQFVGKPKTPRIIHEVGIKASENTIERLRLTSCKISAIIKATSQDRTCEA